MPVVSVNLRAALLYLFVGILVYLAGIYVNTLYYYLYIFLSLFPIFSLVHVGLALSSLRSYQYFDTDQPVKGSTIGYHLRIRGSRLFATGGVRIRFSPIHPRLPDRIPDIALTFNGRNMIEEFYTIRCRYRGTYTIGIESIQISDVLGWLTVRKRGSVRSFHVYPRITTIESPPAGRSYSSLSSPDGSSFGEQDFAMLEGLEGYREGATVKHIAWKKYLTTGVPFLKRFGRSSEVGVTLYIDLRRKGIDSERELEIEDCSIEAAVAVVKALLDERVPVTVSARGEVGYHFEGSEPSSFAEFYRTTPDLMFHSDGVSPLQLLSMEGREPGIDRPVLILTHIADPALLELANGRNRADVAIVVNLVGMNERERRRVVAYRDSMHAEGGNLFLIEHAESLQEDARRWQRRYS